MLKIKQKIALLPRTRVNTKTVFHCQEISFPRSPCRLPFFSFIFFMAQLPEAYIQTDRVYNEYICPNLHFAPPAVAEDTGGE